VTLTLNSMGQNIKDEEDGIEEQVKGRKKRRWNRNK
jgi:hypothetical protein